MLRLFTPTIPIALLLVMHGAGPAPRLRGEEAPSAARAQEAGRALFQGKGNCHACHGPAAKGTAIGPDLTDAEWLNGSGTAQEIAAVIRTGVTTPKKFAVPMPAMGGAQLTAAEIQSIAAYLVAQRPARAAR